MDLGLDVKSGQDEDSPMGSQTCQERVDVKAFTGRGDRHELRALEAEVASLDAQMVLLSQISKQVPSPEIYLMVHRRHRTEYVFLRWREAGGKKRHLDWDKAQDIYAHYEHSMRRWYADLSMKAQALNDRHRDVRKQARVLRKALSRREGFVFARSVPL